MAKKPVDACLELKGEDAVDFHRYMSDPNDITPKGRDMLKKARELAESLDIDEI